MKLCLHNYKERWLSWKNKNKEAIPEISKYNSDILLKYLRDMEKGVNVTGIDTSHEMLKQAKKRKSKIG